MTKCMQLAVGPDCPFLYVTVSNQHLFYPEEDRLYFIYFKTQQRCLAVAWLFSLPDAWL